MPKESLEVSIVIPCLNEAETIGGVVKKAKQCFRDQQIIGEVILADNGSTDGSQKIAEENGARVVIEELKGYGATLRNGFKESLGQYVIIGDADGSHDFSETYKFVEKLREGYDWVSGSRYKGKIKAKAMRWTHQYIGNPVLTFIINILYGSHITDSQCGMRGFRRDVLQIMDLRSKGMDFASELIIKAMRCGLKMTEVPIHVLPDGRSRPPHLKTIPDGWRHLRLILMFAPEKLFIFPGLSIAVVSLFILAVPLGESSQFVKYKALFAALLGTQIFYLGVFKFLYIASDKMKNRSRLMQVILKSSRFEKGLITGLLLFVCAILANKIIEPHLFYWAIAFIGIQITLSSFLVNMLGKDREVYIGSLTVRK